MNLLNLLNSQGKAFVDFTDGKETKKIAWATWIYSYYNLKAMINKLGGTTKLHKFPKNVTLQYPIAHRIMEIQHIR